MFKETESLFSRGVSDAALEHMLREAEEKEREKARLREEEVMNLYQQQLEDYENPVGFSDDPVAELPGNMEVVEAWCREDLQAEVMQECKTTVCKLFGKVGLRVFLAWLYYSDVEEACRELELPKKSTENLVERMLGACRARFGVELFGEKYTGIKYAKSRARLKRSATTYKEDNIYLSEEERFMPLDQLWHHINNKYGVKVSRSTAWYAKRSGYFKKPEAKANGGGKRIYLTDEEMRLPVPDLALRRQINRVTAARAKKRGFFSVNQDNLGKAVENPPPLTADEREILDLPEKIHVINGVKISDLSIRDLMKLVPWITRSTAQRAVARGYLIPGHNRDQKQRVKWAKLLKRLSV